ncbi:MAG: hypothetical protein K9W43_04680 [Candidatus Thorarchaeota archaeon]|nr:hypothetical protein [Candidatus Thorarchaeota archaeon]
MTRTRFEVYILRPAAYASVLLTVNIIVASFLFLFDVILNLFTAVANLTVFEFALFLILGSCLMSRQPLDDSKRYDSSGAPSKSWAMYLLGRDTLLTGVFILMFGGVAYALSLVI